MNGVEILLTTEVVTETTYNWWLAGFIYLGFVILGGIVGFCAAEFWCKGEAAYIGCFINALTGIFIFAAVAVMTAKPTTYETHYKVTIDDSVSMNEFLDKYEIIDQEGKIYTVKEKEQKEN